MAQNQKNEIQNLSKEDDTPDIINKIIKTQRSKKSFKYKNNSHNSKNKSTSINSTFYGTQKKNISNTSVNSSSQIKPTDKLSHNSLNSFNKSNKFSIIKTSYKTRGQLNNNSSTNNQCNCGLSHELNLPRVKSPPNEHICKCGLDILKQIKSYCSKKDDDDCCICGLTKEIKLLYNHSSTNNLLCNCGLDHSILVNGSAELLGENKNNRIKSDSHRNILKNINENIQEINPSKVLYKRGSTYKNNNYTVTNRPISNTYKVKKNYDNYKFDSITHKNNNNKKDNLRSNLSKSFTNLLDFKYSNNSKTFDYKNKNKNNNNENKKREKRLQNEDNFSFDPTKPIKNDKLLYYRLKRNEAIRKRYRILSGNNLLEKSSSFYNPLKSYKQFNKISSDIKEKNNDIRLDRK